MRITASGHAKNGGKMTQMFEEDAKRVKKKNLDGCRRVYTDFYSLYAKTPSASLERKKRADCGKSGHTLRFHSAFHNADSHLV